jgi:hypothetical protein
MKLQWFGPINSGAAVQSAGAGTGTANATSHKITGAVHAVYVRYNDSPPAATTDVTVATAGTSPYVPAITILSIANAATDVLKYPRIQVCNTSGSALTMDGTRILTDKIVIDDGVTVTIAQANTGDSVDVWLCMEG